MVGAWRDGLCKRARVLAWLAGGASLLAGLGSLDWRLELFTHFIPFYLPFLILGALLVKSYLARGLFVLVFLWQSAVCMLAVWPVATAPVLPGTEVKLVSFNVWLFNERYADTLHWLREEKPDVIFLTEYTPAWNVSLKDLQRDYPYRCGQPDNSPFGLSMMSKIATTACDIVTVAGDKPDLQDCGAPNATLFGSLLMSKTVSARCNIAKMQQPYPYVRMVLHDGTVIYGIHPPPPISTALALARNQTLAELAQRIRTEPTRVVVLGDFNLTPYSPVYRNFRQESGLSDAGFPGLPTWSPGFFPPMLPIDRVLVRGVVKSSIERGPDMGSDHRPLLVRVQ